jgi:polyhydroxyalkanoate synthesis regulator phasin
VRDALSKGPLNLVIVTGERIQEVVDDAVERGRMTRDDAEDLVQKILSRGRKQTEDILSDLEALIGRSRENVESAATQTRRRAKDTATRARKGPADRVRREVDRARRVAGIGSSFPISGYDDLTAGQVTDRIAGLSPADLRKVRDYERRNANRKGVLGAIEKRLA